MQEKNVLIISPNGFSSVGCNKTYETIFSSFKKENLKSFFTRPQDPNIDYNYCSNYYSVSESDIISRLLLRTRQCGREVLCNSSTKYNSKIYNSFKNKKIKEIDIFKDVLWKSKLWNTPQFREWCKKIKADLIFFHAPGSSGLHEIAWFVSKYLNIPLAVYFTDDYIISPIYNTLWSRLQQVRRKKFYRKTIDKSFMAFCIGELMAEEYSKYFNRHFNHIMNAVDIVPFADSPIYSSPIIISYFGGLHLNRWKMLVRLASILKEYIHLCVYTASELTDEIQKSFSDAQIEYCGCVVDDELYKARLKSDVLLHVESDDTKNRAYTRLAISTKIPEYLISGRVVLGFGPEEVASMRILKDNDVGVVISSDLADHEIKTSFCKSIYDKSTCESLRWRAYEYARTHFDKKVIAASFKEKLLSCFESTLMKNESLNCK